MMAEHEPVSEGRTWLTRTMVIVLLIGGVCFGAWMLISSTNLFRLIDRSIGGIPASTGGALK